MSVRRLLTFFVLLGFCGITLSCGKKAPPSLPRKAFTPDRQLALFQTVDREILEVRVG